MRLLKHQQPYLLKRLFIKVLARLHSQHTEIQVVYFANLPHLHLYLIVRIKVLLQLQLPLHTNSLSCATLRKLTVHLASCSSRLLTHAAILLIIVKILFPQLVLMTGLGIELLLARGHLMEVVKELVEFCLFLFNPLPVVGSVATHVAAHAKEEDHLDECDEAG